jgi:hypothetical protein
MQAIKSSLRTEPAHVQAKWIRFADKDMRQHENLQRFPDDREAL